MHLQHLHHKFLFLLTVSIQIQNSCTYLWDRPAFLHKANSIFSITKFREFDRRALDKLNHKINNVVYVSDNSFRKVQENSSINYQTYQIKEILKKDFSQLNKISVFLAKRYMIEEIEICENYIKTVDKNYFKNKIHKQISISSGDSGLVSEALLKEKSGKALKVLDYAMMYMGTRLFAAFYSTNKHVEIVGMVALTKIPSSIVLPYPLYSCTTMEVEQRFLISDLFVESKSRRKGIGKLLLSYIEEVVKESTNISHRERNDRKELETWENTEKRERFNESTKRHYKRQSAPDNKRSVMDEFTLSSLIVLFVEKKNSSALTFYKNLGYSAIKDIVEVFSLYTSRYDLSAKTMYTKNKKDLMIKSQPTLGKTNDSTLLMEQNKTFQFNEFGPFFNFSQQTDIQQLTSNNIYYKWL